MLKLINFKETYFDELNVFFPPRTIKNASFPQIEKCTNRQFDTKSENGGETVSFPMNVEHLNRRSQNTPTEFPTSPIHSGRYPAVE